MIRFLIGLLASTFLAMSESDGHGPEEGCTCGADCWVDCTCGK